MDTVGGTIGFSISVVSTAHIFHTTLAVPAADHGTEHAPAFLTGQQSSITVLCTIIDRRTRLLFQQRLSLLPDCFFNDNRIEILVTKPVRFADSSRFAAEIFPTVVDQHAGMALCAAF